MLLLLIVWEGAVRRYDVPKYLLPAPSEVVQALARSWDVLIGTHSRVTLLEAGLGLGLAVLTGVVTGAVLHVVPLLRRAFYPFIVVSQTIPSIVLVPLLVIWFGYGLLPKLLIVVIACFFPVAVAVVDGLDATDASRLKLLRSMGASRWQEFRLVKLPSALPSLFTGLRVAASYAVMAAVIAEWLGADAGLGIYMVRSAHSFRTDQVFAGILLVSLYSVLLFKGIDLLRRIALPWERYVTEQGTRPAEGVPANRRAATARAAEP